MNDKIISEGKTVDEAVLKAVEALGTTIDQVSVEILEEGSAGLLGFGKKLFKVAVSRIQEENLEEEEVVYYGDEEEFSGRDELPLDQVAKKFINSVLAHFKGSFKVQESMDHGEVVVSVTGPDCAILIGRGGETLTALNYLLNLVVNKVSSKKVYVRLDVAGYKQRQEQNLAHSAKRMAARVAKTGKVFEMKPMKSSDRRVVHEALQNFRGVKTYSEGDGMDRRVIIAPDKGDN